MIGIPAGNVKRETQGPQGGLLNDWANRHRSGNRGSLAAFIVSSAAAMRHADRPKRSPSMSMSIMLQPLIALIAGILILLVPRLLNYIVAIYLIVIGLVGLFPTLMR
jgi:hypothetical protein